MATLDEIRAEILETAGLASDDARFPDATMTRIVNRALRNVSAERDWPWNEVRTTITATTDTQTVAIPSGLSKVIRLDIEGRDLRLIQAREAGTFSEDSGRPWGYAVEAETIIWAPVPVSTETFNISYHGYETALSADGDTPSLPDRYLDWLVQTALIQISSIIRDTDLYAIADRETKKWSKRASDEYLRTTASMKIQTRNDWSV